MSKLVLIFFFLLIFKGFARKVFPAFEEIIYLLSDFSIILIAALSVLHRFSSKVRVDRIELRAVRIYILFALVFGILAGYNFLVGNSLLLILIGLREWLLPPVCFFVFYKFFQDEKNVDKFVGLTVFVAVISAVCGLVVVMFGLEIAALSPLDDHLDSHSSDFGEFFYVASIFDSPEKYTFFLLFAICLLIPLLKVKPRGWGAILLVCFLGIAVSGRRVGTILALFIYMLYKKKSDFLRAKNGGVFLSMLVVACGFLYFFVPSLFFVLATRTFDDAVYYLGAWLVGDVVAVFELGVSALSPFFGHGSPGARAYVENDFWGVESLLSRCLYFLGTIPTVVFISSLMAVVIAQFRIYKITRGFHGFGALAFCASTVLWNLKSGNILVWPELFYIAVALSFSELWRFRRSVCISMESRRRQTVPNILSGYR